MGKVGTGWSRTTSSKIRKQLDTVVSPRFPLTKPVRKPQGDVVKSTVVAEVECGKRNYLPGNLFFLLTLEREATFHARA